ncbi:MAG TPA: sugar phosphate isomerase/epimerase [Acidobacteriaceae bacterium]|nr:sugar phosphate isomerase/epimerase [Acidobacteriaceae bacterium]
MNAYSFTKLLNAKIKHHQQGMDLYDVVDFCADHNIDGFDATGHFFPDFPARPIAVSDFKPEELRSLLQQRKLKFVALSSGELNIDPAFEGQQLDMHVSNARFVRAVDGLYLQVLDELKPYPRKVVPEECVRLGKLLTKLGKRVSDAGVKLGYHNHMNTISEHPENLQRVMDASDPRYVGLELDTAHYVAGGGDPAEAILHYGDRLLFLHLKDVVDLPVDTPGVKYPFKFVELGRGQVNLPAVMNALQKTKYSGWAIVELDRVPDKSRTPKGCAAISKDYLQNQLHVAV